LGFDYSTLYRLGRARRSKCKNICSRLRSSAPHQPLPTRAATIADGVPPLHAPNPSDGAAVREQFRRCPHPLRAAASSLAHQCGRRKAPATRANEEEGHGLEALDAGDGRRQRQQRRRPLLSASNTLPLRTCQRTLSLLHRHRCRRHLSQRPARATCSTKKGNKIL
jgi:hypothetical protein